MTDIRFTPGGDRRVTAGSLVRVIAPRLVPSIYQTAPTYTIDLCVGFERVGTANAFEFDAVTRHLATGEWVLRAPVEGMDVADPASVDSFVLWDDESPPNLVFAGIVRRVPGVDGGVARRLTSSGDEFTYTGIDIFGLLGLRTVWPTPSTVPPWADDYDERTGRGSEVAAEFIEANIGTSALAARQVSGLTVVDAGAGTSSTWSGRLQPLDELVGRICRESGISCRARKTTEGFAFILTSPTDRSGSVIVTDQGDIEDLSQFLVPATASHVVGAGQGELSSRSFAVADSGATGIDRVEIVYENTNISTTTGLQTATDTELILAGADVSVDGQVTETAAQRIRYLVDYDLGDWLGIEVDGVRYSSQVEAVRFEINAQRESIRPVLGRVATNDLLTMTRRIDGLSDRFNRQIA